jgi:hypothetical protein
MGVDSSPEVMNKHVQFSDMTKIKSMEMDFTHGRTSSRNSLPVISGTKISPQRYETQRLSDIYADRVTRSIPKYNTDPGILSPKLKMGPNTLELQLEIVNKNRSMATSGERMESPGVMTPYLDEKSMDGQAGSHQQCYKEANNEEMTIISGANSLIWKKVISPEVRSRIHDYLDKLDSDPSPNYHLQDPKYSSVQ